MEHKQYSSGEQTDKQKADKKLKATECGGCEKDHCNNCEAKYLAHEKTERITK